MKMAKLRDADATFKGVGNSTATGKYLIPMGLLFEESGMTVNGVENHLHFQLRTTGWRPGGPKAPSFITNPNSYWLGVQARSAKDGSRCVFLRLTNQIKDVLTFENAPPGASCP